MAFAPSFSVNQSISNLAVLGIIDTSTGTDTAITGRRIYIQMANGTYLVPTGTTTDYINFPLSAGSSITASVLNVDYALNITVQWIGIAGSTQGQVLYSATGLYCFESYGNTFAYQLTQYQVADSNLVTNTNYWGNKIKLIVNLDDAVQATTLAGDVFSAQASLNRETYLQNNRKVFF